MSVGLISISDWLEQRLVRETIDQLLASATGIRS